MAEWKYEPESHQVRGSDGYTVCEMFTTLDDDGTWMHANGRAVAALPDLFAALVFIRDYARDSRTGRMLTGEGYAMAEAAINKAKGIES